MEAGFRTGTLDASGVQEVNVGAKAVPMTATIASVAGGRLIELSFDGINYYTPTNDASTTAMIAVAVMAPVAKIRFTGALGDTWGVR